jgi:di/tripeptidase
VSIRFTHTVTERFLRYVVIDTQSDPASETCPSTEKQKDLGRLLAAELQAMGIRDAHLARRGNRSRRRQGRPEKARRRFRLHHRWRNRGQYRG